jgi:hypothetical protein
MPAQMPMFVIFIFWFMMTWKWTNFCYSLKVYLWWRIFEISMLMVGLHGCLSMCRVFFYIILEQVDFGSWYFFM